jgi:hypothetical protein
MIQDDSNYDSYSYSYSSIDKLVFLAEQRSNV